jgi:hypothetical protein
MNSLNLNTSEVSTYRVANSVAADERNKPTAYTLIGYHQGCEKGRAKDQYCMDTSLPASQRLRLRRLAMASELFVLHDMNFYCRMSLHTLTNYCSLTS